MSLRYSVGSDTILFSHVNLNLCWIDCCVVLKVRISIIKSLSNEISAVFSRSTSKTFIIISSAIQFTANSNRSNRDLYTHKSLDLSIKKGYHMINTQRTLCSIIFLKISALNSHWRLPQIRLIWCSKRSANPTGSQNVSSLLIDRAIFSIYTGTVSFNKLCLFSGRQYEHNQHDYKDKYMIMTTLDICICRETVVKVNKKFFRCKLVSVDDKHRQQLLSSGYIVRSRK